MIQVYKKNELFIIENTVTDIIYPNLTREEALVLLEKFDRNEPKHRCDFAIKEDNISFEYASLDDKDKTISDLEQKLALTEKALELACEELYDSDSISICAYCPYDIQDECADECPQNTKVLEKYFKNKAKEMLESE